MQVRIFRPLHPPCNYVSQESTLTQQLSQLTMSRGKKPITQPTQSTPENSETESVALTAVNPAPKSPISTASPRPTPPEAISMGPSPERKQVKTQTQTANPQLY